MKRYIIKIVYKMIKKIKDKEDIKQIVIIIIIGLILFSALWTLRTDIYLKDKYLWYVFMGNKYYHIHGYSKSSEFTEKAIILDPERLEAYNLRIMNLLETPEFDPKLFNIYIKTYREKDKKNLSLDFYYFSLGWYNLINDEINESIFYLEKSLSLNPHHPYTSFLLGISYLKINEFQKSEQYFNYIINLSDKDMNKLFAYNTWINIDEFGIIGLFHAGRGYLFLRMNSTEYFDEAENEFRQADLYCLNCRSYVSNLIE